MQEHFGEVKSRAKREKVEKQNFIELKIKNKLQRTQEVFTGNENLQIQR